MGKLQVKPIYVDDIEGITHAVSRLVIVEGEGIGFAAFEVKRTSHEDTLYIPVRELDFEGNFAEELQIAIYNNGGKVTCPDCRGAMILSGFTDTQGNDVNAWVCKCSNEWM